MHLSAAAAVPPVERRQRLTPAERDRLRERLVAQLARGHLTQLARGSGYLALGPGLVLCGPTLAGRLLGLAFPAALLFLAATALGLVFRVLASREGGRLRRLGASTIVHQVPIPGWRPIETVLLGITALAGAVLAAEAFFPGFLPRPALLRVGALWMGSALAAAVVLVVETRYSSRRR